MIKYENTPLSAQLPQPSFFQRSVSASLAFLIITSLGSLFQHRIVTHHVSTAEANQTQLFWLNSKPHAANAASASASAPTKIPSSVTPTKPNPKITNTSGKPIAETVEKVAITPPISTQTSNAVNDTHDFDHAFSRAEPANQVTSPTTLKPDHDKLMLAYKESKTDIEKLAEKRGTHLYQPRLTKQEKFQQAAKRAAKPDCIRPGGAGLLSIFVIAYEVTADKCK